MRGLVDHWCARCGRAETALKAAQRDLSKVKSKSVRQRDAILRLERQVEQLRADKSALAFDLHKARARIRQMVAEHEP